MKKILLAILTTLLIILTYILLAKGINIGNFKIASIKDIKSANTDLNSDVDKSNELVDISYPTEKGSLEEAIKNLKIAKQKYEAKNVNSQNSIGTIEVKTYKIHYLWTRLGNYKTARNLKSLNLDLKTTQSADIYDLQFNVVGEYSDIIGFLTNIEDDDELKFELKNFEMQPYKITTTTTITDGDNSSNKVTQKTNPYDTITEIVTTGAQKESNTNNNFTINNVGQNQNTTNNEENTQNTQNTEGSTTGSKTTIYDPKWVEATFTVENIGITLD